MQLAIKPLAQKTPSPSRYAEQPTSYLFGFYETQQGTAQAWQFRTPLSETGLPLHRYPFSKQPDGINRLLGEARVVVKHDPATSTTRYEIALPWTCVPDVTVDRGAVIAGLEVKLTSDRWSGLFSAGDRGAAKVDQLVFQPHWATGFTTSIPWKLE